MNDEIAVELRNKIILKMRERKKTIMDVSSYSGIDCDRIRDVFENPTEYDIITLSSITSSLKIH